MGGSWRFIGSIVSILLFVGLGLLRSSLATTYHNELAANVVGVGMWLAFAYIGFDILTSPETSVLYRLNRRWTPAGLESVGGMLILVTGLFFAAFQIALIVGPFFR